MRLQQWRLSEAHLPLGEIRFIGQWQTQVSLQGDVTFSQTGTQQVLPLARFTLANAPDNSVLLDLNLRKPILGFENDTLRAKFKIRSTRIGVEITPFTTQIPMVFGVHLGESSSLSFHMRF